MTVFSVSCRNKQDQKPLSAGGGPVNETRIVADKPVPELKITYRLMTEGIKQLDSQYSPEQIHILLGLNRIDKKALRRVDTLIVPDTFIANWLAYAPFPAHLQALDSISKILLFSYRLQAFAAYENGKLTRWGPTSLGKKSTPTHTGLFHCNWKAKRTISTIDDEWILDWYFNLENKSGVSMHQYELPGYPASHACARLAEHDAKWIYHWAAQWKLSDNGQQILAYGTPVIIFGSYDFSKKLHRNILNGKDAVRLTEDELREVIHPHLSLILERQRTRKILDTASSDLGIR